MKNIYIGLMSGTSVDGLDIAAIELFDENNFNTLFYEEIEYNNSLRKRILNAGLNKANTAEICTLNFELANFYAKEINKFIAKYKIDKTRINAIGSHGQTIYHIPQPNEEEVRSTLQIADGSVIANLTGLNVISDFRPAHIANGGLGAPIVSFGDFMLFNSNDENTIRIWQNIGGISNSTILAKNFKDVLSFDNGPGNMIIDYLCDKSFNEKFDRDGHWASQGKIDYKLLEKLLEDPYYDMDIPKTTGREKFNDKFCEKIFTWTDNKFDLLRTVTYFTAKTIVDSYTKFVAKKNQNYEVIITGGGALNSLLIKDIDRLLKNTNFKLIKSQELKINPEAKEAIIIAYLAHRTINNNWSALINGKKTILGKVSKYYDK